jgi:lambda repressor-like predicted transcriptional regulator
VAQAVLDANVGTFARQAGQADRREVWGSLVRLIANQLGVRPDDIAPETRFAEDLNSG